MCYGLCQAEITVYIVAQTVPLLRVLSFKKKKTSRASGHSDTGRMTSVAAETGKGKKAQAKQQAATVVASQLRQQPSVELVQLPSGKIVAADSEAGRQFQAAASREPPADVSSSSQSAGATGPMLQEAETAIAAGAERNSVNSVEDEVHRLWADM